jgi:hypothetical protein
MENPETRVSPFKAQKVNAGDTRKVNRYTYTSLIKKKQKN